MKKSRPKIPAKTQLKLWTLAAGRCEFFGCNKIVWRDDLTFTEGNYSNIAHIISWIPTGPRGDVVFSKKLAGDISNLMLVCRDHAHLIDRPENINRYTIERLRSYKQNHEDRIRIQTSIKDDRKTTIVRFQANIRGRRVEVPFTDAYSAIIATERYPSDEKGILIDLTPLDYSLQKSFWKTAVQQISTAVARGLSTGNNEETPRHLSIFGLAPIPLLVYLGYKLGSAIPADIYLNPRGRGWLCGKPPSKSRPVRFQLRTAGGSRKSKHVALSVAISGSNAPPEIYKAAKMSIPIYELRIAHPAIDALISGVDLEAFRKIYRVALDQIRDRHGKTATIHLFGAMPPCAAVICGREVIHGLDPSIIVYEHVSQKLGFASAIKIN